jgi:deoxyhypusine synthase
LKRYQYGVRICPEPVHWGGLSGSTYSEAVSWGKFVPPEEGGRFAEVLEDATVALPLVAGAVLERIGYWKQARQASTSVKKTAHRRSPLGVGSR